MFYNARWPAPALLGYDSSLGRFAQADTIIPGGAQSLDRYAYVNNNPVNFTDPSGHYANCSGLVSGYGLEQCEAAHKKIDEELEKYKPTDSCKGDCYDAYLTFVSVAHLLGHIPTMRELLYMTASAEYAGSVPGKSKAADYAQEGLARSYYEACYGDASNHVMFNLLLVFTLGLIR